MSKNIYLVLFCFLVQNSSFSQTDTVHYHQICGTIKKNNTKVNGALEVKANSILKSNQVYFFFHIGKSDSISIVLNDSLINKHYVYINPNRTGDDPDYSIKLNIKSKKDVLTIYFENDKSFFKIPIDKKYRVYGVVYQTGVWQQCIYVEKKKYFSFH